MSSLDMLLEQAREPEPSDDGFTVKVRASVTVTPGHTAWWNRSRFVTRPTMLAAAAVLVTGGALAAAVRTSNDADSVPEKTTRAIESNDRSSRALTGATAITASPQASKTVTQVDDGVKRSFKKGDLEWGYTSAHTAFIQDNRNGLRLQTESYTNSFATKMPSKVTLTLTNTSKKAIGIYSADGCALSVTPFKSDGEGAGAVVPVAPTDSSGKQCAGQESQPGEGEKFVLHPGQSRTENVKVSLEADGAWGLVGMCECYQVSPEDAGGSSEDPVGKVPNLLLAQVEQGTGQDGKDWQLFTPPIAVKAR